jgi:hypothetical protein
VPAVTVVAVTVPAVSIAVASASSFGLGRPILREKSRIGWWDRRLRPSSGPAKSGAPSE